MSDSNASFGEQLRMHRLRAGLSQDDLAERAGLTIDAISALERGVRRSPYPSTVAALSKALGLSDESHAMFADAARPHRRRRKAPLPAAGVVTADRPSPPGMVGTLFGRDEVVGELADLLNPAAANKVRLLTLVGLGGVGKTQLALAVARELSARFRDGVAFIDLSAVHQDGLVAATIAGALSLHEFVGGSARELLLQHLRSREMLLVVDNFEHLMRAASLLQDLVQQCPRLQILVTSRAALRLSAERRFLVEPLDTPAASMSAGSEELNRSPSVRLFLERARLVAPRLSVSDARMVAIADICRKLDGLPLAIELAAARSSHLSPGALLKRLQPRLALLTGGPDDMPARQRTLRNTLDWSYELLGPLERGLFRRLAVFAGGASLEAIETICADGLFDHAVVDHLRSLVDASLVHMTESDGGQSRFDMLETVREYAEERLDESGEADVLRKRHCEWFLALAEQVPPEALDAAQLVRLEQEQDNLRCALRWTIECREAELGMRLSVGYSTVWVQRGRHAEARGWFAEVLAIDPTGAASVARARALLLSGYHAMCAGDLTQAEAFVRCAVATAEHVGDTHSMAIGALFQGDVLFDRGQPAKARTHFERAVELAGQAGNHFWETLARQMVAFALLETEDLDSARACVDDVLRLCAAQDYGPIRARALSISAALAARAGHLALARAQFDESLAFLTEFGNKRAIADVHLMAAHCELDHRNLSSATRHLTEVLLIAGQSRDRWAIIRALEGVAYALAAIDAQRAVRLASAAGAARAANGIDYAPLDRSRLHRWMPGAKHALGEDGMEQATLAGRISSLMDALADGQAACELIASGLTPLATGANVTESRMSYPPQTLRY